MWDGLVHTVFSASYYGDANENKGAILVFTADQKDYRRPYEVKYGHPPPHTLRATLFAFHSLLDPAREF